MQNRHMLKCEDYRGKIVVFENMNYDKHKRKHPELEDSTFFPEKIKTALKTPTLTIPGYRNNSLCYYYEEFRIDDIIKFTKVVVHEVTKTIGGQEVLVIKTAHKTGHIQEFKYPELSPIYQQEGWTI